MSYIESSNIVVFPCSKHRTQHDASSKLFYEQNITNLVRQVTDYPSYIISGTVDTRTGLVTETLKLTLFGYYVELKEGTTLVNDNSTPNVYVKVNLSSNDPKELFGQDNVEGEFTAIEILGGTSNPDPLYCLHLLHNYGSSEDEWKLVEDSYLKFNTTSIRDLKEIDGKHNI
jgi:hypothetical protein